MTSQYTRRIIDDDLDDFLAEISAISLDGPKGVGKTATALRRARTVHRLDRTIDTDALRANLSLLQTDARPVLLDEWQHLPQVWNEVRHLVDAGAPAGSFLLAGSAAPTGARIHSGAARIMRLRMRPMSLAERQLAAPTVSLGRILTGADESPSGRCDLGVNDYAREITASGLPGLRRLSRRSRNAQLAGYISNIVSADFLEQGLTVRRPDTLRRWLRAFAAATGTNSTYSAILDAATTGEGDKPSASTTIAYRDVLQKLWLLDEVQPWDPGGISLGRPAKTPKHFLADPALAASLLGLDETTLARGIDEPAFGPRYGGLTGRLFEALVGLSLQTYAAHNDAALSYWRSQDGRREVDFIVQQGRQVVAIEVKLAPDVGSDEVAHLIWLRDRLGSDFADGIVITTGPQAYRRQDGIAVVPAALLGP